jgi:hypothetical protein
LNRKHETKEKMMAFIRRDWTPQAADEWTKEDLIASVISPLAYAAVTLGVALSLLAIPAGYVTLALGIVLVIVMLWVIDPKLKTISTEYEKKQKNYLRDLEKIQRWEAE